MFSKFNQMFHTCYTILRTGLSNILFINSYIYVYTWSIQLNKGTDGKGGVYFIVVTCGA